MEISLTLLKPECLWSTFDQNLRDGVEKLDRQKKKWLNLLRNTGAYIYKYSKGGKPQLRFFIVNENDELMWGSRKGVVSGKESLCDVEFIVYGSESERFGKLEKNTKPWLCFSLILPHRTVDLQCEDEPMVFHFFAIILMQLTSWFLGVQSLAPMTQLYKSRGALLWSRLKMKIQKIAANRGMEPWKFLSRITGPVPELQPEIPQPQRGISALFPSWFPSKRSSGKH